MAYELTSAAEKVGIDTLRIGERAALVSRVWRQCLVAVMLKSVLNISKI